MPQFEPGDESGTVLLGCLVQDYLRIWRSDGRAECVRVLHPSELREFVARGLVPRTSTETGSLAGFGRLDAAGVLVIGKRPFPVEACDDPEVTDELWAAAIEVLQDAAAGAVARGERLLVEPGGPNATRATYAVAGAKREQGAWSLYVEAAPAPRGPSWPVAPEGASGWGARAPAGREALATLGTLLREAVSPWARSPLDLSFTFAAQPDGPWPAKVPAAIKILLREMRADVAELHASRQLSRARELSARVSAHFNHNSFPVFFLGDLRSRLALVHPNPRQRDNYAAEYEGAFEYADFDEYLERHRRFGYHRWEIGDEYQSPSDHKLIRFLRAWGVVDFVEAESRDEQRIQLARVVDRALQLELIPYGSARFPAEGFPPDALAPHYERLMGVITAYPRDYVVLCGSEFDRLFESRVVARDDHSFRLPTSTGVSRVEYHFSNLLLDVYGREVPVGLAPNFASPGVPIDAYGQTCKELYREIRR
jgi:hypothetical protein